MLFTIPDHHHVNSGSNRPQVDDLFETAMHLNISDFTDLLGKTLAWTSLRRKSLTSSIC